MRELHENDLPESNVIEVTRQDIILERRRRKKEKTDQFQAEFAPTQKYGLWKFCQHLFSNFFTDDKWPLRDLTEIFRRITLGELKQVLISTPPRFGKSFTTHIWIGWWLGYDNAGSFMRNCYNDSLANDMSKMTMDIIAMDAYREVFPDTKVDPRANSKEIWQLLGTTTAAYFGAGFGGTITGRGCNRAAIFDDPIKNPEEAMSLTYLQKVNMNIEYAMETRVDATANVAKIIIQTRWNSQDPIGLRENNPDWVSFFFPAYDEENDCSMCEAMFPTPVLQNIRNNWIENELKWMWDALYMCKPTDATFAKLTLEDLNLFSMSDLKALGEYDETGMWCDYANKGTDNMSAPFGVRYGADIYITGAIFSNEDSTELEKPLVKKMLEHRPERATFESNAGGQEFAERLMEKYEDAFHQAGIEVFTQTATTNKEIRILLRLGQIKKHCYFLAKNERDAHYQRFMDNLLNYGRFKGGKDDAPDSLAGLLSMFGDVGDIEVNIVNAEKIIDINEGVNNFDTEEDENDEVVVFSSND